MNRTTQITELINQYDNELSNSLKYLIKDIVMDYRKELTAWMNIMTHQSNTEAYSTLLLQDAIWNRNSTKKRLEMNTISNR